jgi:hypothetical protein
VERRKANFDALRKNYPFRRLFSATTLTLIHPSPTLEARLTALGFTVKTQTAATKTRKVPTKKAAKPKTASSRATSRKRPATS